MTTSLSLKTIDSNPVVAVLQVYPLTTSNVSLDVFFEILSGLAASDIFFQEIAELLKIGTPEA